MKRITLSASHFQKMHNLIFFKVYKFNPRKPSALNIRGDLDYLSKELRFFIWEGYPLPCVPLYLCAENLIMLDLPNSNIRQLGNENQHFPNLKEIILWDSKHLTVLPDLSHAPKIENVYVAGCVNLNEIHSSIVPGNLINLYVENEGPKRINIGRSRKGTRSRLIMVFNYLDLEKLSFHKIRMKVLVRGDNICGLRFEHVEVLLEEMTELRKGTQCLASLLPFVSLIEFEHDFNQHYTYDISLRYGYYDSSPHSFVINLNMRGDRGDGGVEGPLRRQMINDRPHFFQDGGERKEEEEERYSKSTSLMEDEEEEDDELIIMEYCGSNSNATFTRLPHSITRWSLLKKLRLKESDIIGNAGCCIPQVSILKSLIGLSRDHHSTRIQPLFDFKLSFPNISPSRDYGVPTDICYSLGRRNPQQYPRSFYFLGYEIYGSMDKNDWDAKISLSWTRAQNNYYLNLSAYLSSSASI